MQFQWGMGVSLLNRLRQVAAAARKKKGLRDDSGLSYSSIGPLESGVYGAQKVFQVCSSVRLLSS